MSSRKTCELCVPLAAIAATFAVIAPGASAATVPTQQLGCESTVAQVTSLLTSSPVAPVTQGVAGSLADPCTSLAPVTTAAGTILNLGSLGAVTGLLGGAPTLTGPASAVTDGVAGVGTMSALATAGENGVSIPTPAGTVTIPAATASVGYACQNGSVVPQVSSTLPSITIAGQTFTLPSTGATETFPLTLPVLGTQIGTVTVDPDHLTSTSDTTDIADVDVAGVADIAVGQAAVTQPANDVCSQLATPAGPQGNPGSPGSPGTGTPGSPGNPGGSGASGTPGASGSTVCPAGTVYSGGNCTLAVNGSGVVSVVPAYSGEIQGGTVISLAAARKRYHSACLKGGGPNYVVVGTKKADRITVSKVRVRVLALGGNDTVTVKGGARTCVDGGAGNDRITNLKTNRVSLYGGAGKDRIRVGNGPALISAGAGNDVITAGTGRDLINAGAGNNLVTARGRHDRVTAGNGKTVAHLPAAAMAYARHHGVSRVYALRG